MDRRRFVLTCATVPLTVPLASACVRYQFVQGVVDGRRVVVPRTALNAQKFALVEAVSLSFPIYLHETAPNEFSAVLTRCMHRGCTVEPADGHLVCPCHGSEYSNVGAVLKGPTEKPLIRFQVEHDAQNIYILDVTDGTP